MEESVPWISDNGLRLTSRTFHSISLAWDPVDHEGPWVEVQIKKGPDWTTVYKGYRHEYKVDDLVPNAQFHFRMRFNGDNTDNTTWGSVISGATDTLPAYAEDLHRAVQCNAENMVIRILATCK